MKIQNEYTHFQEVYLINDTDQLMRQVVQINILPGGLLIYVLSCAGECTEHYAEEISATKNVI